MTWHEQNMAWNHGDVMTNVLETTPLIVETHVLRAGKETENIRPWRFSIQDHCRLQERLYAEGQGSWATSNANQKLPECFPTRCQSSSPALTTPTVLIRHCSIIVFGGQRESLSDTRRKILLHEQGRRVNGHAEVLHIPPWYSKARSIKVARKVATEAW